MNDRIYKIDECHFECKSIIIKLCEEMEIVFVDLEQEKRVA